jgi:hypothetical protein
MPNCLYLNSNTSRKTLKLAVLLLLSPLFFYGQTLTGLWVGALSNDSTTIRKDQSFEIALTEYRGKVYGYSRSEFIVNDTLYYIVKRVKGTIEGVRLIKGLRSPAFFTEIRKTVPGIWQEPGKPIKQKDIIV